MGSIIGIDVGISTTKIVGINADGKVVAPMRIKATDPVTSLYGAFGKYLYDNHIRLVDVERVMLTGVGSDYIDKQVFARPTFKVEEFVANGLGARHESQLDRMVVVSMGTGTSLVQYENGDISHIGGVGIGGGTLLGLSRVMLQTDEIPLVAELAQRGDISKVNVLIGEISANSIPGLPSDATASLFGNAKNDARREDLALGILWLVLQSIGSCAYLSALGSGIKDFVLIGNLTLLPQCRDVFPAMEKLYGVRFHIPQHSEFCTAIGAALSQKGKGM